MNPDEPTVLTKKEKIKIRKKDEAWNTKSAEAKLETFASMIDKSILSYPHLIRRSFISGIFTGLGATVGVTLVFIFLSYALNFLGGVQFLRDWLKIDELATQINNLNPKK